MEIKINKEISEYSEGLFFGLNTRQFLCSAAAVGVAVGTYFGLKDILGRETVSWVCILCAAPFAAAGFFKYNGMTFEKFIAAYIRSEFICSGKRVYKSENVLYNLYKEGLRDAKKTVKKKKAYTAQRSAVDTDR